jgi:peptide/nickel transport system substrate-binding protein
MQSTGVQFLDVVKGAQAVIDGKASTISGVKANGNKLVVQLTKASPDFIARTTMPFVQAIDPTLAGQIDANGINQYASCGPYYFSSRTPGRSVTLKRNPFYKGGRAANVDTIQVNVGNDVAVEYQNVEKGTSDYASTGIPATEWKTVVNKYGLNKKDGRVQVRQLLDVRYVAMNRSRPLFKDNVGLAKAVNWAVDRQAFSAQGGFLYGKRTGQILPPGMLGYKPQGIYPLRVTANTIKQAKKLAEGNLRGGKAVLWAANSGTAPLQAQLIQYNLKQIGIDAEVKLLPRAQQFTNAGNPQTATFDLTVERWGADYADPYDFVNILLDGAQVSNPQHNNYAYFNVAKYNKQMTAASLLTGPKRGTAYAALDGAMMRENPPWAPLVNSNDRTFLSARVGCVTINEAQGSGPLLNVVCIK